MLLQEQAAWRKVEAVLHRIVKRVERIFYVFDGVIRHDRGPLQLTFSDQSVLRLEVAADGERMDPCASRWVDPFEEPLDEVNTLFVQESGKWSVFDVSGTPPFSSIIEKAVANVKPIFDNFDALAGVQFQIGKEFLDFCIAADDAYVFWGEHNETLTEWEYRVGECDWTGASPDDERRR